MSALPAAAVKANEDTLSEALAASHITEEETTAAAEQDEKEDHVEGEDEDLEDGEIKEEEDDGSPKTVFHDARRFNVKHPLYSTWTLYFDNPGAKNLPKAPIATPSAPGLSHGGWLDDIRKVMSFDSIEEFWGLYNNIVPPSQLPPKANYYMFKDGIIPAWEDPQNKNGGKWSIQMPRDKSKSVIDKMWLYTMLASIGETFESELDGPAPTQSDQVTGIIMSARPAFYRLSIWTREAPDVNLPDEDPLMKRILTIGKYFKVAVLGYELDQKLVAGSYQTEVTYESHKDSEKKGNKNKKLI